MRMKSKVLSEIFAVTRSNWILPSLMTVALVAVILGLTHH